MRRERGGRCATTARPGFPQSAFRHSLRNIQLEGDPADWPDCPWIDDDRYELGPALTPDEVIPDDLVEPDPDVFPLTDAATIAELRRVECTAWSRWLATRAEPQP